MAKVTSKYQVTVPKAIADQYRIRPGDEIEWVPAGDTIRVLPGSAQPASSGDPAERVRLFDQATERQRRRARAATTVAKNRGWAREDLYGRGRSRWHQHPRLPVRSKVP